MKQYRLNVEEDSTGDLFIEESIYDILEEQYDQSYSTTGSQEIGSPVIILSISDIVKHLSDEFQNIQNPQMKDLFFSLFLSFQNHLTSYSLQRNETSHLPKIHITILRDTSILIEWIFYSFRIGFAIEPEIDQSSWYLVSNEQLENVTGSGFLKKEHIDTIVDDLFEFIFKNT